MGTVLLNVAYFTSLRVLAQCKGEPRRVNS